ncbi:hypothetical protein Ddye_026117 [Dipteronia dyeriana]|uniref:Calmodulin binding protein-like N-terminal domain-containing protein n=1 Tax=Dipteronia dyeriana TaxID=168575 RepID=A0AAD9TM59_9ROSI|nr:hypothetical protein Ddye_026117 [Dipteronia dyeriana]
MVILILILRTKKKWTENFNSKVENGRKEKRPPVIGELYITLRDGVGIINDLCFTDNSRRIKCGKFRLGARVADSIGGDVSIKEAISEAFEVKDYRGKSKLDMVS